MNRIASQLMIVAALLAAGTVSRSRADDGQIYPGSHCSYYAPQAADLYFTPSGQGANGLKNIGSSTKAVVCPALRVAPASDLEQVEVNVQGDVSCKLYIRDATGGGNTMLGPDPLQLNFGSGGHTFTWASGDGDIAVPNDATFALYCTVPPGGVIYNYHVTSN